jgi:hypothetical protein
METRPFGFLSMELLNSIEYTFASPVAKGVSVRIRFTHQAIFKEQHRGRLGFEELCP